MVRTMHTTAGVAYVIDSSKPNHWRVPDYLGEVRRRVNERERTAPFVSVCDICNIESTPADYFSQAITGLVDHAMLAHSPRESYTLHPAPYPNRSLWQTTCNERGCVWKSRRYIERSRAIKAAEDHLLIEHTPRNITSNPRLEAWSISPERAAFLTVPKEDTMRKREQVEAEAKMLERRLSSLVAELEQIDKLPKDEYSNGTIVSFDVQFSADGTEYSYAAIKAVDAWFVTGKITYGLTWEALLELMAEDYRVEDGGYHFNVHVPTTGKMVHTDE